MVEGKVYIYTRFPLLEPIFNESKWFGQIPHAYLGPR
jgi:hypothetical protein